MNGDHRMTLLRLWKALEQNKRFDLFRQQMRIVRPPSIV